MEQKPRRRWRRAALWAGIALAALCGYVLSSGPSLCGAAYLVTNPSRTVRVSSVETALLSYTPLLELAAILKVTPQLEGYVSLWTTPEMTVLIRGRDLFMERSVNVDGNVYMISTAIRPRLF